MSSFGKIHLCVQRFDVFDSNAGGNGRICVSPMQHTVDMVACFCGFDLVEIDAQETATR
jgi:hypothetical protein